MRLALGIIVAVLVVAAFAAIIAGVWNKAEREWWW